MKKLVIAAVCIGAAYVAYPYVSLYQLADAVETKDAAALEDRIDWSNLRQGLKDDISAVLAMSMQKPQEANDSTGGFEMLGAVLGAKFADIMIDQMVTPAGLVMTMRRQAASHPGMSLHPLQSVTGAFFDSPTQFLVTVKNDHGEPITLRMSLEGLSWKVSRLISSPNQIAEFARSMRNRSN